MDLLIQAASGSVTLTPKIQTLLLAISKDCVPQSWLPSHIPSCSGVQNWLMSLTHKMEILQSLCQDDNADASQTCCYNIAAFWNPKLFVKCLLQEHARKEYIEVFKLSIQAQVLGSSDPPSHPPDAGAYITGLQLHNAHWDPQRAAIQLPDNTSNQSALPVVWLKPSVHNLATENSTHSTYSCPLYAADVCHQEYVGDDVILNIDLPCTLDASTWIQKRAYAVASL